MYSQKHLGTCSRISRILALPLLLFAIVWLAIPTQAHASSDVWTITDDRAVYYGGYLDVEVAPKGDWTPASYQWYAELQSGSQTYRAALTESDMETWYSGVTTAHLRCGTKSFINGSDDDDWGLLRYQCVITDTTGKKHYSDYYKMHAYSKAEFNHKIELEGGFAIDTSKCEPAAEAVGHVKNMAMKVGQTQKFSFTPSSVPAWLTSSDPKVETYYDILDPDNEHERVQNTSMAFKPEKEGTYLIAPVQVLYLGTTKTDYSSATFYLVEVTKSGASSPVGDTLDAFEGRVEFKTWQEEYSVNETIPESAFYLPTAYNDKLTANGEWYYLSDGAWSSCAADGITKFLAGKTYAFRVTATAKGDTKFNPNERSVDATALRASVREGSVNKAPYNFLPVTGQSTATRVVYTIRTVAIPEASVPPHVSTDIPMPDSYDSNIFLDVNDETPHSEDIAWMANAGITTGWDNGDGTYLFKPLENVARADMAAFIFRLAKSWGKVTDSWIPSAEQKQAFSDVTETTPHAREIWWLASTGISKGWTASDGTKTFRPFDNVARQDMAAFLFRLAKNYGIGDASDSWTAPNSAKTRFKDVDPNDPDNHHNEVWWLADKGISTGWDMGDGTYEFRGEWNVARCDMAAFLHRLDNLA